MSLKIEELFGFPPKCPAGKTFVENRKCPFSLSKCVKTFNDKEISGVCTGSLVKKSEPVICCPIRLYSQDYYVLQCVADEVFGPGCQLQLSGVTPSGGDNAVYVFGKGQGKELRLPTKSGVGGYFVDWILAKIDSTGSLEEFVAVEVQTIDTTGSYREQQIALLNGSSNPLRSQASFNWENVNKRILPQLIFKGHVLRREKLCKKGLYFICPEPVYQRIAMRLGEMEDIHPGQGTVTFHRHQLDMESGVIPYPVKLVASFTTTVDQMALAFSAPKNLPPAGVYEEAIRSELKKGFHQTGELPLF